MRAPRPGYTLLETLTVMLILGVLAGAFTVFYRGTPPERATEKEAEKLARWLTNLETVSNRTGQSFKLVCPGSVTRDYIEAVWQLTSKKNTYTSTYDCEFNRNGGHDADSLYSPQWSAMVPTITIRVRRDNTEHYVIVSQHGRVRTAKYPNSATGK